MPYIFEVMGPKNLLFIILLVPLVSAPTLNNFTKPDFGKYPDLVINTKDIVTFDFTDKKKITYYYNTINTEIPLLLGNKNLKLVVKNVYYDTENEEYALIWISGKNVNIYETLYQNKAVVLEIWDEKIKIVAESIIDHDNIDYLTITGFIENSKTEIEPFEEDAEELVVSQDNLVEETHEEISQSEKESEDIPLILIIFNVLVIIAIFFGYFIKKK